ncbi:RNA polymerase sigma factor [Flavobacteriales bacterium]|jgi:RNA polymerase sigma factor (sigma-70 family)|nr:RNA polymerase sigma factor [Flavobacteriales bacterium]MDC0015304.1 RNA polymerase sigma factor [Flavobacteriales bacterium]MDC1370507.1 RNA polymerase sigma factor [Flavobacteriales bacterium]|tara:strand:- start:2873 stop:3370 length:498 start_codon:yes stop_codon:yes gene_type:complete
MKNETQFNVIYNEYAKLVYNLSLHYLHNTEDAQEATQDVFVKIYNKIEGFNNKSSLKTWIYRITINHSLDVIKSKNRKLRVLFSREYEDNDKIDFDHPGIKVESKEVVEKIMKEINSLPENQKTALILKGIEGLSQKEIASILKIKEKALESLLSRARANLKKRL